MTKDSLSKLLFWTVIVFLIAVSLFTYRNLNNYTSEVKATRHSSRVLKTLEITLSSLKDAEIGQRGYQLTRDTSYLEPYYLSLRTLPSQLRDNVEVVSVQPNRGSDGTMQLIMRPCPVDFVHPHDPVA